MVFLVPKGCSVYVQLAQITPPLKSGAIRLFQLERSVTVAKDLDINSEHATLCIPTNIHGLVSCCLLIGFLILIGSPLRCCKYSCGYLQHSVCGIAVMVKKGIMGFVLVFLEMKLLTCLHLQLWDLVKP